MVRVNSSAISKIRALWKRYADKDYRDQFVASKIDADLSAQLYALREQHGLTQEELGHRAKMAQSRIAKLEGSCEGVSLSTLKRLASAFDVALVVRFVPFSEFLSQALNENIDRQILAFANDNVPFETAVKFTIRDSGPRYDLDLSSDGRGANFKIPTNSDHRGVTVQ